MSSNKNLKIRAVERDEPDLRRLARALIDLAIEQSQTANTTTGNDVAADEAAPAMPDESGETEVPRAA